MYVRDGNQEIDADLISARNRDSVLRFGLMLAVALVLASSSPPELRVAVFGGLLFLSALVASVFAALSRDRLMAPHFTRWDETAALLGLSTAVGFLVDPALVESAIQQSQLQVAATARADG